MEKDGGPAFPSIETDDAYNDDREMYGRTYSFGGMTLRDYFAAKAMNALLAVQLKNERSAESETIAQASYRMADAMLKVRQSR